MANRRAMTARRTRPPQSRDGDGSGAVAEVAGTPLILQLLSHARGMPGRAAFGVAFRPASP